MFEKNQESNNIFDLKQYWCHTCQQQFTSHLRPGVDDVICPRCNNDFCQLFTSKTKPYTFQPYQKQLRPKYRKFIRYTAQAVLVALAQYSQDINAQKVRQITQEDIKKLKFKIDKSIQECLICKEQFKIGNQALRCPCGHIFHSECLSQWLEYKNNCPKCRARILNHLDN